MKKRRLSVQPPTDSSATETNNQSAVVETLEHRRFVEFCDACKRYKYIGLCYGSPGVGKTVSARYYANWDRVEEFWERLTEAKATAEEIAASTTAFYTAPVVGSPHVIDREIENIRGRLHNEVIDLRRLAEQKELVRLLDVLNDLRDPQKNPNGYRSKEADDAEGAYLAQRKRMTGLAASVPDPTTLLVVDEADRLKMAGLEQIRSIFDQGRIGLILIGMPGLEKRLARYPQFYSRIGFVHEFRPLSADEIRQLFQRPWTPRGVKLPCNSIDAATAASIIRITGGNFRLLNRLLTQIERILEINGLQEVSKAVVEAARESLVIGQV